MKINQLFIALVIFGSQISLAQETFLTAEDAVRICKTKLIELQRNYGVALNKIDHMLIAEENLRQTTIMENNGYFSYWSNSEVVEKSKEKTASIKAIKQSLEKSIPQKLNIECRDADSLEGFIESVELIKALQTEIDRQSEEARKL